MIATRTVFAIEVANVWDTLQCSKQCIFYGTMKWQGRLYNAMLWTAHIRIQMCRVEPRLTATIRVERMDGYINISNRKIIFILPLSSFACPHYLARCFSTLTDEVTHLQQPKSIPSFSVQNINIYLCLADIYLRLYPTAWPFLDDQELTCQLSQTYHALAYMWNIGRLPRFHHFSLSKHKTKYINHV